MNSIWIGIASGLAIALTSCSESAQSQGTEPDAEQSAIESAPSGTYTNDKGHTYVGLSYDHLGFSRSVLRFSDVDARISLNAANVESSAISVTIDARSLDTGVPELDERLAKSDFFDFEQFPEITFQSSSLQQTSANAGTVQGDLTIKGITKPAILNVTLNGVGPHPRDQFPTLGISATSTLSRSDFDLGYLVPHVGDEILVEIEAEFILKD